MKIRVLIVNCQTQLHRVEYESILSVRVQILNCLYEECPENKFLTQPKDVRS